ncbi:unnamed protein product, partial [Cyprideis torosa]
MNFVNCNSGPSSDKEGFASLVHELKTAFEPRGLLLTAALSPNPKVIDAGYDVASLSRDLDLMTILTFSYQGAWDEKTGHGAPAYYRPGDDNLFFNVNSSIQYWLDQGAPRDKMLLSFPLYGPEFELKNPDDNGLDAPTTDNYEEMKYFQ